MAAISAEERPMFWADARCEAVIQNAMPRMAVPPEDTMSATAF
jgi:hypothetical protein